MRRSGLSTGTCKQAGELEIVPVASSQAGLGANMLSGVSTSAPVCTDLLIISHLCNDSEITPVEMECWGIHVPHVHYK